MATSKKVKALKSFDSIVGFVCFGQVFDLPFAWVSDYTRDGLVLEWQEPEVKPRPEPPEDRHEVTPGYKTMKTKSK